MAYDEYQVERIRQVLTEQKANFFDKAMMGGRIFMMNDKMLCGMHTDKKLGISLLMLRVGEEAYPDLIKLDHTLPMDFTGRPMKGYLFVKPDGFDMQVDLEFWLQKGIDYNPFAKQSKKRKKKVD